ncbi:transposase, partial [Neisseria perflava]
MVYLGSDVSKSTIDCYILSDEKSEHFKIENNSDGLNKLLEQFKHQDLSKIHACCESTGIYYLKVAEFLYSYQIKISVVNPLVIKNYARLKLSRIKTDKQDSKLIAEYCQNQKPKLWQPDSPLKQQIRSLNRRADQLNSLLVMEKNRHQVADDCVKLSIEETIGFLTEQIQSVKRQIQDLIDNNTDLKQKQGILETIPGIGKTTAAWLLSVLVDLNKFPNAKHFVSYLGLTPVIKESGTSVRGLSVISKMGDRAVRKALYMPARSVCTRSKLWRPWYEQKLEAGKHPKEIYVAMMKKICIYAYTCLQKNQPFDENLH